MDSGEIQGLGQLDFFKCLGKNHPFVLYQYHLRLNGSSHFPYISSSDLLGVPTKDLEKDASHVLKLIHPEDYVSVMESIQASAKGLDQWACDFRILHPNDTIIWVRGKANPEKLSDGSILWHGYFHNISDFKLAQSELLRSKNLMIDIQAISKTGGWEYTVETGEAYWTDELYKIHEMENEPGIDIYTESLKCYSPADNKMMLEHFSRCIREGIGYELELPFISAKNNKKWVKIKAAPLFENHKIVKVVGSLSDITDQKLAEIKLNKLSKAIEQSPTSVVITDLDGIIEYVNPAFTINTGYTFEECTGKKPNIVKSGKHSIAFYKNIWDKISTGGVWQGNIQNKK